MHVSYTESFAEKSQETDRTLRRIRKIIDDRLVEEVLRRLRQGGSTQNEAAS